MTSSLKPKSDSPCHENRRDFGDFEKNRRKIGLYRNYGRKNDFSEIVSKSER